VTAAARAGSAAPASRLEAGGELRTLLAAVARCAGEARVETYLVGGAIRDLLLGRPFVDVDVSVHAEPDRTRELAAALASELGGRVKARHERFGTATVELAGGTRLDLATTRRESYPVPGALPVITGGAAIGDDLARRDFTIHAMAAPIEPGGALGDVVDPFGGARDAEARVLRLLHGRSLADDPTRALRAARYGARLGFEWDPGFGPALEESRAAGSWTRISGDRLRRSLEEVLAESSRAAAIARLRSAGVLDDVVPGWGRARSGELGADGTIETRWAALLAPVDPPLRRAVAERLNFSRALRRATSTGR